MRRYARYMDDVLIVHHDKAYLHALREQIERFLFEALALHTNRKTQVTPVGASEGPVLDWLDWLGYRLWATHRRLRAGSVRRMRRRLAWMRRAYARGEIRMPEITTRLRGWLGHAAHADTWRVRAQLLEGFSL